MGEFIWFRQIPSSLLLLLFLLSEAHCSLSSAPLCLSDDKSALLQFKSTVSIDDSAGDSTSLKRWNESTNCCTWVGVTCDTETAQVIGLDLSFSKLVGPLPASLGNLTKITSLDFSYNALEGEIPDVFGNLNKLTTLDFSGCNFSGQLPPSLFNLPQLTYLELSSNRLEGPLPTHVTVTGLQNLTQFHAKDNLITGGIPSWLFTLPSLEYLDLSNNSLTGPIDEIRKPNSVQIVSLAHNDIHGEIPASFFGLVKLIDLNLSSNNLGWVIESDMLSKLENLETLDLSSNNLSGVAKLDVLSKLQSLETLDLSNNTLLSLSCDDGVNSTFQELRSLSLFSCNVSRFPNCLRSTRSLEFLDLSYNAVRGSILEWELQGWEQLTTLNLSHNLLEGHLPAPPPSLRKFLISENKLTGEIPPSICNLDSLHILDLSSNYLGGMIPACLGNFSNRISTINLQRNNLSGRIPDFCVEGGSLKSLALNDNQLEGILPRSLVNCSSLKFLNLANNTLIDTFPNQLGVLPDLQVIILRLNRFYGRLDTSKATPGFLSLQVIDLSQNHFTGPLPTKFFRSLRAVKVVVSHRTIADVSETFPGVGRINNPRCDLYSRCVPKAGGRAGDNEGEDGYKNVIKVTMKRLERELDLEKSLTGFTLIDFSNNRFDGRIPMVLGELHSLLMLNLSHNSLTGPLPSAMASMAALESLDLSSNKLHGRIPSELTRLTFLAVLNLSQNNFVGPIPVGNQFNTFENDSYAGNLDLCGFPLSKKCGNEEEPSKLVEDDGSAISFLWKLVMMGYGCGVVLGLSTGYIVFTTGRPWWFVRTVERDWQRNFTRWILGIQATQN